MRPLDGPLLAIAAGALAVRVGATDLVYRYLRPSMRPWLVAAGVTLIALGAVAGWARFRGADRDHAHDTDHDTGDHDHDHGAPAGEHQHDHRASWLCWLLLLPVVLGAIVDPRALGAASVRQVGVNRLPASEPFDLAQYLATHSFGGQAPQITLAQYIGATRHEAGRAALRGTDIRLLGFVAPDPDDPSRRLLMRMQVGCCAADAVALPIEITGDPTATPWPARDQWIEVTGRFDEAATDRVTAPGQGATDLALAAFTATAVRPADAPTEPYEYP